MKAGDRVRCWKYRPLKYGTVQERVTTQTAIIKWDEHSGGGTSLENVRNLDVVSGR